MTDNHHDTRLVPQHQRIITSSQWVFDKNRDDTSSSTPIHSSSSSGTSSLVSSATLDHKSHHVQIKPKLSPTVPTDRESKKKTKELENMKLQMEYNSARQENDKLKNVIAKLRQEIDTYSKVLDERTSLPSRQHLQNAPPMSTLLVNGNSNNKRRKKTDPKDARKYAMKQDPVPSQVCKNPQERQRQHQHQHQQQQQQSREDSDLGVNPSLTFPQSALPNIIPTNKIMTNDVMFGPLSSDMAISEVTPNLHQGSSTSMEQEIVSKKKNKTKKTTKKNTNSVEDIGPDDVMLMHTLTDVLAHMD